MEEKRSQPILARSEYEELIHDVRSGLPGIDILQLSRKDLGSLIALTTWHPRTLGCLVVGSGLSRALLGRRPGAGYPVSRMTQILYALGRVGLATDVDPARRLSSSAVKDSLSCALSENVIPALDVGPEDMLYLRGISRLYTITPRFDHVKTLLDSGLKSAKDIAGMGEEVFKSQFRKELGGEMDAKKIYGRACEVDDARKDNCY